MNGQKPGMDSPSELAYDESVARQREQSDIIRRDLALLRGDKSRWRQHRQIEIVCAACNDPILEVIATPTFRVLVYRRPETHDPEAPDSFADLNARISHMRKRGLPRRHRSKVAGTSFRPIPTPWAPEAHESLDLICRCSMWPRKAAEVARLLRDTPERRKVIWTPQR